MFGVGSKREGALECSRMVVRRLKVVVGVRVFVKLEVNVPMDVDRKLEV